MKIFINNIKMPTDIVGVELLDTNPNNGTKLYPYKIVIPKDDFYRDFNDVYQRLLPEINSIDNEVEIEELTDNQLISCCESLKLVIFNKCCPKQPDNQMYDYALNNWDNVIIENDSIVILGQAKHINSLDDKYWMHFLIIAFVAIILIFFINTCMSIYQLTGI